MSVFDKHHDALEVHETMMGHARGRLAVALDLLTDSLALVGQHGVYCRSERFPGQPKMDVALILEQLNDAKELSRARWSSSVLNRLWALGTGPCSVVPRTVCEAHGPVHRSAEHGAAKPPSTLPRSQHVQR
jgi:hypothetical protein